MGGSIPRLEEHPEIKKQEYTMESNVSGDVNMHCDDSFVEIPSRCSVLYGLKMPEVGGDTIWVNCEAAYDALSEPMQQFLEPLCAVHDLSANFGNIAPGVEDPKAKMRIHEHYPPVEHPCYSHASGFGAQMHLRERDGDESNRRARSGRERGDFAVPDHSPEKTAISLSPALDRRHAGRLG